MLPHGEWRRGPRFASWLLLRSHAGGILGNTLWNTVWWSIALYESTTEQPFIVPVVALDWAPPGTIAILVAFGGSAVAAFISLMYEIWTDGTAREDARSSVRYPENTAPPPPPDASAEDLRHRAPAPGHLFAGAPSPAPSHFTPSATRNPARPGEELDEYGRLKRIPDAPPPVAWPPGNGRVI